MHRGIWNTRVIPFVCAGPYCTCMLDSFLLFPLFRRERHTRHRHPCCEAVREACPGFLVVTPHPKGFKPLEMPKFQKPGRGQIDTVAKKNPTVQSSTRRPVPGGPPVASSRVCLPLMMDARASGPQGPAPGPDGDLTRAGGILVVTVTRAPEGGGSKIEKTSTWN